MKAYITCPVSNRQERLDLLPIIKETAQAKGVEPFVFQISDKPEEIFPRDYNLIKSCDLIIAEVSEPSHGVGAEIGLSYELGLKRILLLETGKNLSRLIQGVPETIIIEYKDIKELKDKLNKALENLNSK